jgi:hypothetical protein
VDNISEEKIVELNIPTGVPLVYELDPNLKPIKHYYLGDPGGNPQSSGSSRAVVQQGTNQKSLSATGRVKQASWQ